MTNKEIYYVLIFCKIAKLGFGIPNSPFRLKRKRLIKFLF